MEKVQDYNYLIKIKRKLITLYILNFCDGVFTKALTSTGSFIEINPFLRACLDSKIFYLIKFLLPMLILVVIYKRMAGATRKRLQAAEALITITVMIYAVINLVHIYHFISYFIFPNYRE